MKFKEWWSNTSIPRRPYGLVSIPSQEEAYRAGYLAGLEDAAKVARKYSDEYSYEYDVDWQRGFKASAVAIEVDIRALKGGE